MTKSRTALCVAVVTGVLTTACGGNPSGPSSAKVSFAIGFQGTGTFTATLAGQTYNTNGFKAVSLSPGEYDVTGTYNMPNSLFAISFSSGSAGVQAGSLRSSDALLNFPCSVSYDSSPSARTFALRITVTADPNTSCHTPGQGIN